MAKPRCDRAIAEPPRDRAVAGIAARQHGVITLHQLKGLGFSRGGVSARVRRGLLHPIHRGAYAVGHPLLSPKGRWLAAVLACGPGAVLSHRSAAGLWGLLEVGASIDVSSPGRAGRSRPGIVAHSAATISPCDLTIVQAMPCTSVARTLLDLAEVVSPRLLRRACEQAEVLRLLDLRAAEEMLASANGRVGAPRLCAALAAWSSETALSREELEKRFLELCLGAGLPRPDVNAWIPQCAMEVDFMWPAHGLVAETDSVRFHHTRTAFERDRRRDQQLVLAGFAVVRFTWRQVVGEPQVVAATLQAVLESRRS